MKFNIWIVFPTILLIATSLHYDSHLAINSSACIPPGLWNATSLTCNCNNGSVLNATTGLCQCVATTPWLHKGVCTACNFPDVFDPATKECFICPPGYSYNMTVHFCLSINCPTGLVYNSTVHNCTCPSSTPYMYNGGCHQCPLNNYISKGTCHPCWHGSFFNKTSHSCQCNVTAGFFPKGVNITGCIGCFFPNYFNFKQHKCLSCTVGKIFNIVAGKCEYCPLQFPYWNGKECGPCPGNNTYWNNTVRKC